MLQVGIQIMLNLDTSASATLWLFFLAGFGSQDVQLGVAQHYPASVDMNHVYSTTFG